MSELFKNKYKMIALLMAFLLVISGVSGAIAFSKNSDLIKAEESEPELPEDSEPEEPEPQEEPPTQEVEPHMPSTMRGVFLTPGVDFLTSDNNTEDSVKEEIDSALKAASELTMNTVIVNTNFEDKVIYNTKDAHQVFGSFDIMEYIVTKAKDQDFYVFGVFDLSSFKAGSLPVTAMAVGAGAQPDSLADNLREYASNYQLDGILLSAYTNPTKEDSYSLYSKLGGAIGFDNFMRQTPEMLVQNAARIINAETPATQIGILADPVWANEAEEQEGSATKATFTALKDGNADTRAFVQNGLIDFVAVNAYGSLADTDVPFKEVVSWWADLAHDANVPLYVVQSSSKAATDAVGWAGSDELVKQAMELEVVNGVRGSAFDNLQRLVANPSDISTQLLRYYKDEIEVEEDLILQELEMTRPQQTVFTTNEQQQTFTGASDPEATVTINDLEIRTDASGYFTVTYDLKAGENRFVITHKDKTIEYVITRQIDILTGISPTGTVTTDGGMKISISATAYRDAQVTASVSGSSLVLNIDDSVVEESDRNSSYQTFTGKFVAPAATAEEQHLGEIVVTASWGGESKTLTGGSVVVNKKAKIEDGTPIVITAGQAKTYPATTLDNIPSASCYPLPQGAMDYAVGEEIVYKDVPYTVLASGLRVRSEDINGANDYASGNTVSGISVDVSGGYTYVRLTTAQKVSYNFSYHGDRVSIRLNNTNSVPADMTLSKNPLFTEAVWNDSTLVLSFVKVGGFMGYKGYYDGDDLVFRFTNPPSSLAGARVAIDPGHGGKDYGALGFLADYPEKALNSAIASYLSDELVQRGASVLLLDTSDGMDLPTRVAKAEEFGADIFVSVHNNTAPNASAHGTEVYYFHPFAKNMAAHAASQVSGGLGTNNRGARQSYYNVTLSPQMTSILVECGFMTNKDEYEKLIRGKYQDRIAVSIADALEAGIANAYTGISGGGSENTGGSVVVDGGGTGSSAGSSTGTGQAVTGVQLNRNSLSLPPGKSGGLSATIIPNDAANQRVTWKSSNTGVATVNESGRVTAVAEGKATITVTTEEGGFTASCEVTVAKNDSSSGKEVPVEDAYLKEDDVTINTGDTRQLEIVVVPNDATNKDVLWRSSDTGIVTVDDKGVIRGRKAGTTTVTAATVDGNIISTCHVEVRDEGSGSDGDSSVDLSKLDWLNLKVDSKDMYINSAQTLRLESDDGKVLPNSSFQWRSSDRDIMTVDNNGVVKAGRKEGSTTITVYHEKYEHLYDSYTISVTRDRVRVTGIELNEEYLEMEVGTTSKILKATVQPSNATNKQVNWRVSNTSIASIDSNGVITAKRKGSTTIIVSSAEGDSRATCRLDIVEEIDIYDMYFDYSADTLELRVGDEDYFQVIFEPSGITNKTVTWTSSDPSVVTVDSKGNIKAIKAGRATITATAKADSYYRDSCQITVLE